MKIMKSIVLLICFVLVSSLVFAISQQGVHEPGTGINDPELKETNQGTGQGQDTETEPKGDKSGQDEAINTAAQTKNLGEAQQLQVKEQVKTQLNDLKQTMEQKQQQLNTQAEGTGEKVQQMMKNQNQVKIAAQTLTQMENVLGSKGKQISTIAKEFDNSIQSTIKSEEQIQTRSGFSRFFAGGDKKAAEEIEAQVTKNQERVKELKQLKDQSEANEEVKTMMQEQIQQMEQEQLRLQDLAQNEKKSKGLLGWIWK
jgi:hypothetical protein